MIAFIILYTYYSKKRESSFSRSNELLGAVSRYVPLSKADFDNAPLSKPAKPIQKQDDKQKLNF